VSAKTGDSSVGIVFILDNQGLCSFDFSHEASINLLASFSRHDAPFSFLRKLFEFLTCGADIRMFPPQIGKSQTVNQTIQDIP
jgi:hypothetical protein